jgi:hypothetical protein
MGPNLTECTPALSVGALAFMLSSPFAAAQTVSDPQTGLAVKPPASYSAKTAPGRGRYTAVIEVKRDSDRDTGCKVAFHPIAQNSGLNQAQINALVDTPERRAVIESSLGTLYQVTGIEQVQHAGVRGSVATATLKPLPGLPARAGDMISVFYLLETPTGRTTVVCVSDKQTIMQRRNEFDAVLRGVCRANVSCA